jgi:hypothetical protein
MPNDQGADGVRCKAAHARTHPLVTASLLALTGILVAYGYWG